MYKEKRPTDLHVSRDVALWLTADEAIVSAARSLTCRDDLDSYNVYCTVASFELPYKLAYNNNTSTISLCQ